MARQPARLTHVLPASGSIASTIIYCWQFLHWPTLVQLGLVQPVKGPVLCGIPQLHGVATLGGLLCTVDNAEAILIQLRPVYEDGELDRGALNIICTIIICSWLWNDRPLRRKIVYGQFSEISGMPILAWSIDERTRRKLTLACCWLAASLVQFCLYTNFFEVVCHFMSWLPRRWQFHNAQPRSTTADALQY